MESNKNLLGDMWFFLASLNYTEQNWEIGPHLLQIKSLLNKFNSLKKITKEKLREKRKKDFLGPFWRNCAEMFGLHFTISYLNDFKIL